MHHSGSTGSPACALPSRLELCSHTWRLGRSGIPFTNTAPATTSNPPWLLEQEFGGEIAAQTHFYGGAGSSGQHYINDFARQIVTGQLTGAALLTHGECVHSLRGMSKEAAAAITAAVPEPPARPRSLRAAEMPSINPGEELQQRQEIMHGITAPNYTYQGQFIAFALSSHCLSLAFHCFPTAFH